MPRRLLTVDELEYVFQDYLHELQAAVPAGFLVAGLHAACVVPDICAALPPVDTQNRPLMDS